MGWRGGSLAAVLVRGAVHHYCVGQCSALFVCGRHSRQVRGDEASPPLILLFLTPLLVRVAGCPVRVFLALSCWYATPCSLCVQSAQSDYPSDARRVPVVLCAVALPRCAHSSPLVSMTRALGAVPVQGAGRTCTGGPCSSAFPAPVRCSACVVCVWAGAPVPVSLCPAPGRVPPRWLVRLAGAALVASRGVRGPALTLPLPSVFGAGGRGRHEGAWGVQLVPL